MLDRTPPLPDDPLAGLRADILAEAALCAAHAGVVAVLRGLILTALARLVARLEDMVALWRAGGLPALQQPRAASPRLRAARHAPARRMARALRRRRTAPRRAAARLRAPSRIAPAPTLAALTLAALTLAAPTLAALTLPRPMVAPARLWGFGRAPPRHRPPAPPLSPALSCGKFVTLS